MSQDRQQSQNNRPPKADQDKPLSLHGMTPEEAIRKALATPPPKTDKKPAKPDGRDTAR
ncbi:MAG: hypothetical protein SH868_17935 [Bythopirellula sp.]|nr:hypothetical protein [Bythopirellula sp.]